MNILFVCSSNIRRSQMCQVICEIRYPEHNYRSAGFFDSSWSVDQSTVNHISEHLGKEFGDKIAGRYSKKINERFVDWADIIFAMDQVSKDLIELSWEEAKGKIHVLSNYTGDNYLVEPGIAATDLAKLLEKAILKVN